VWWPADGYKLSAEGENCEENEALALADAARPRRFSRRKSSRERDALLAAIGR
jgi:hypothetical protein